nr:hypothetical protein [Solirubrobacterales bacterium]
AAQLGRRYVLIDSNPEAVATMHARLGTVAPSTPAAGTAAPVTEAQR